MIEARWLVTTATTTAGVVSVLVSSVFLRFGF